MLEYKTVKYHIPQQGIYLYARTNEGKTEMIVLNSTDQEQTLPSEHYNALTMDGKPVRKLPAASKWISHVIWFYRLASHWSSNFKSLPPKGD